jgi:hypothetical protein
MIKIKTIPFGELAIDETSSFESLTVKINLYGKEQAINISFSDCNLYAGKNLRAFAVPGQ